MLFIRLIYSLIIRTLLFVTFMYPHGVFEIKFLVLVLVLALMHGYQRDQSSEKMHLPVLVLYCASIDQLDDCMCSHAP